ncbi:nitrate reductase associated protein [Pseudanabaena sp. lw0831]|uniref:nitrate reductase associated protein n=1 Tax=Pseudanabaena sp. lw0831 TaxID=1357935 RepID=UPI001915CE96|nr:nitrate reductase associated protein [Pseudanabaena sp. lw0831]GBO52918.1 nitrate reductase associated protein [Pseudanabaena sp. lw0831]
MLQFFEFEADFVAALRCIPMQVRYKLDTCGIKLKLQHWHSFSTIQRQKLIDLPCETDTEIQDYRDNLRSQVFQYFNTYPSDLLIDQEPAWMQMEVIPISVVQQAQELNCAIAIAQWQDLTPLQRFALIKLSTSSHENNNFLPALQEFGLLP